MAKISGVVITHNEERHIARCLESIKDLVDEVVVVDSLSTDRTKEICQAYNARFVEQPFLGYRDQKNFALDQASYDYVLSLDADEALSDELKNIILDLKRNLDFDAYRFNRLNNYCGKWLRHGGWYPDIKTRLWNKNKGRWGGMNIHETVVLPKNANVKHIKADILHYSYATVDEHFQQTLKFARIYADAAYEKGRRANFFVKALFGPWFKFVRRYFLRMGFLDGYYGFVACLNSAILNYFKYISLIELQKKGKNNSEKQKNSSYEKEKQPGKKDSQVF